MRDEVGFSYAGAALGAAATEGHLDHTAIDMTGVYVIGVEDTATEVDTIEPQITTIEDPQEVP